MRFSVPPEHGTAQTPICIAIFWDVYWDVPSWGAPPSPPMRTEFQNFGNGVPAGATTTWKAGLCTSFLSNLASSPSNFYQQSIQPIWNAKCVGCHSGSTPPVGFNLGELAPPNLPGSSWQMLLAGRVVPGNDDPAAVGNKVLKRTTNPTTQRMPPNCFRAPEPPNGNLPCLPQSDIDKIKAWLRSGAN